jgi:cell division protein FtsZ
VQEEVAEAAAAAVEAAMTEAEPASETTYGKEEEPELAAPAAPRIQTETKMVSPIPDPSEFPPIARKELEARGKEIGKIAEQSHKKQRKSLLERLASVGLGRRDEPIAPEELDKPTNEPRIVEARQPEASSSAEADAEMATSEPAAKPAAAPEVAENVHQLTPQIDPELDDEDLEIPAFLRRQAN